MCTLLHGVHDRLSVKAIYRNYPMFSDAKNNYFGEKQGVSENKGYQKTCFRTLKNNYLCDRVDTQLQPHNHLLGCRNPIATKDQPYPHPHPSIQKHYDIVGTQGNVLYTNKPQHPFMGRDVNSYIYFLYALQKMI